MDEFDVHMFDEGNNPKVERTDGASQLTEQSQNPRMPPCDSVKDSRDVTKGFPMKSCLVRQREGQEIVRFRAKVQVRHYTPETLGNPLLQQERLGKTIKLVKRIKMMENDVEYQRMREAKIRRLFEANAKEGLTSPMYYKNETERKKVVQRYMLYKDLLDCQKLGLNGDSLSRLSSLIVDKKEKGEVQRVHDEPRPADQFASAEDMEVLYELERNMRLYQNDDSSEERREANRRHHRELRDIRRQQSGPRSRAYNLYRTMSTPFRRIANSCRHNFREAVETYRIFNVLNNMH